MLTASYDKMARVWDATTGKQLAKLEGHLGSVVDAEFSPDGKCVVTAAFDTRSRRRTPNRLRCRAASWVKATKAGTKEVEYSVVPARKNEPLTVDEERAFQNKKTVDEVIEGMRAKERSGNTEE